MPQLDRGGAAAGAPALLGPEWPANAARDLKTWTSGARAQVSEAVDQVLEAWRAAWGIARDPGELRCEAAWAATQPLPGARAWRELAGAEGVWWVVLSSSSEVASADDIVASALFGASPSEGTIAAGVARGASGDAEARLARSFATSGRASAAARIEEAMRPWSGALALVAPWCGARLVLLLDAEAVSGLVRSPSPVALRRTRTVPVVPVVRAVETRTARVRAEIEPVSVDLGTLAALRPGDVLCTRHALHAPLLVRLAGTDSAEAPPVASGFLGKLGTTLAVELAAGPGHHESGV